MLYLKHLKKLYKYFMKKYRLFLQFQAKSRVKEVYTQTCSILSQQGMRDCELFGLAILSGELCCSFAQSYIYSRSRTLTDYARPTFMSIKLDRITDTPVNYQVYYLCLPIPKSQ